MPISRSRCTLFRILAVLLSVEGGAAGQTGEAPSPEEVDGNRQSLADVEAISAGKQISGGDQAPPRSGKHKPEFNAQLEEFLAGLHPPTVEQIIASLEPIPSLEEVPASLPDDTEPSDGEAMTGQEQNQARTGELEDKIQELREQARYGWASTP